MQKLYTFEEVKNIVIDKGYVPLFSYYKHREKIDIQDLNGYKMKVDFHELNRNTIPRVFDPRNPYTIENIKLWCKLNNKQFQLLSKEYVNSNKKLQWKCLKHNCGEVFEKGWDTIHNGQGCLYCSGRKVGLSNCLATKRPDLAKEWHPTKNGDLTPYDVTCGSVIKVWWLCSRCGNEWQSKINQRIRNGCPKHRIEKMAIGKATPPSNKNLFVINPKLCEEWDYLKNKKGPECYYPTSAKRVWWKCKKCGYEWESSISNRNYHGCPKCNNSKGENKVEEYLLQNKIKYEMFFRFNDCCNIRQLPFDFVIFNNDNILLCIIEYDGRQHFDSDEFFGGNIAFEKRQFNDQIKTSYCKKNNIPLLRIPYWEFDNIEQILDNFLSNFNQIQLKQIV